jgi:hypothetical protein
MKNLDNIGVVLPCEEEGLAVALIQKNHILPKAIDLWGVTKRKDWNWR